MAALVAGPWTSPWSQPLPPPPSSPPGAEYETRSAEVDDALAGHSWLFPPGASAAGPASPGTTPVARGPQSHDFLSQYEFAYLRTEEAKAIVAILLQPSSCEQRPGDSLAQCFGRALEKFALTAYQVLSWSMRGHVVQLEEDRQNLVTEAGQAIVFLVQQGLVVLHRDLVFCLESFGASKGRHRNEQHWMCQCLQRTIESGIAVAPPEDVAKWRGMTKARMQNEPEMYSNVDVRAWEHIMELLEPSKESRTRDFTAIHAEAFTTQLKIQLCMGSNRSQLLVGLKHAGELTTKLKQHNAFGADEVRRLFNDRRFDRKERRELLHGVLQSAPPSFMHEVLAGIDDMDVDASERDDDEMLLVRDLIMSLRADIRSCPHTYYRMKSEWLAGRWGGVVDGQQMTPEQVCDHIEDEDNHEELLRTAVNRCIKRGGKFEAARMLARPASHGSRVYEANRNDKQLTYLMSLYSEVERPEDSFRPIQAETLVLPLPDGETFPLVVDEAGPALEQLEADLLVNEQPRVIGVWWVWRCLDPRIDFWPRASALGIVYDDTLCVVDFISLEGLADEDGEDEARGKDVVRRILQAPHLLKVVHDLDELAVQVLQRAVVLKSDLHSQAPKYPSIAPVLDLKVVMAYVRQAAPGDPRCSNLGRLAFEFLRLELCNAEALGNFERRPMRLTQMHYLLTLAWCPWMILRTLCSFGFLESSSGGPGSISRVAVEALVMRFGEADQPPNGWSWHARNMSFAMQNADRSAENAADYEAIMGPYAKNVWTDESADGVAWREKLPRPHPRVDPRVVMDALRPWRFGSGDAMRPAMAMVELLFDRGSAAAHLDAMHVAYGKATESAT